MTGIVTQRLNEQGRIEPGTEGWWQVWGASARHIQPGDMVLSKSGDEFHEREIVTTEDSLLTVKVTTTEGDTVWYGKLQPIVVLRRGTHHTLAP